MRRRVLSRARLAEPRPTATLPDSWAAIAQAQCDAARRPRGRLHHHNARTLLEASTEEGRARHVVRHPNGGGGRSSGKRNERAQDDGTFRQNWPGDAPGAIGACRWRPLRDCGGRLFGPELSSARRRGLRPSPSRPDGGCNDIMARTIVDILNTYVLYRATISDREPRGRVGCRGLGVSGSRDFVATAFYDHLGPFRDHALQAEHAWQPADSHAPGAAGDRRLVLVVNGSSEIEVSRASSPMRRKTRSRSRGPRTGNVDIHRATLLHRRHGFEFEYCLRSTQWHRSDQPRSLSNSVDAMSATRANPEALSTVATCAPLV